MPTQPKKKTNNKYAATSWSKELIRDVEVPSGQVCQVRIPGVQGLITAGLLDSIDSLTSLVQTEHIDRMEKGAATTPTAEDMANLAKNGPALVQGLKLMDRVVCHVVLQPEVLPIPDDDGARQPGAVYTDMLEMTDKIYLFQLVLGGVQDLETFRKEFDETLGSVEALTGVSPSSL